MSEFIDREKAIANIKAAYCCGCENYNGVRCRACQIMDAMDVLEDEPAVVPDAQRWRNTAEEPPKEEDGDCCGRVLIAHAGAHCAVATSLQYARENPEAVRVWMPLPKLPWEAEK